jgi:hypothetical protein
MTTLAREVGAAPSTIRRWRTQDNWGDKLERAIYLYQAQPMAWIESAESLRISADVLLEESRSQGDNTHEVRFGDSYVSVGRKMRVSQLLGESYLVLSGMALENLLKGIIALREPASVVKRSASLNKTIRTHSLWELSRIAQMDLSDATFEAKQFLAKLTSYVIWQGRYPVPLEFKRHEISRFDSGQDPAQVRWLWNRAAQRLNDVLRSGNGVLDIMPRLNWPPGS